MSTPLSALYRRAQMRLTVSLLLSAVGAFAVPFALYNAFGNGPAFSMVLLALVPWAWSLGNVWKHTLRDIHAVNQRLRVLELEA
jgi:hypothetical protein